MAVEIVRDLHAIVPAGGTGKRLWPMARIADPKFLKDLTGSGRSLLQDTVKRIEKVCSPDHIAIVTERSLTGQVRDQLPELPADAIIAEPIQRHSMAAVALATAVISREEPEAIVGVFPADHVIKDEDAFAATVRAAAEVARMGRVVSVGVSPVAPATSFGYIAMGERVIGPENVEVRTVTGFAEKPEPKQANSFVLSGDYLWNTGIILARADVLLGHVARLQPALAAVVSKVAGAWGTPEFTQVIDAEWPSIERISIDRALAIPLAQEGVGLVVRGEFDWDDMRDLRSLADSLDRRLDGLKVLGADSAMAVDARAGLVVSTTDRQIVILGLDDAVVVDTPDVLLVTTGSRCKEVPVAVERLAKDERKDVL